ncbi:hypothetical protein ACHQM5_007908 [Ranunculus cassubicifolius]
MVINTVSMRNLSKSELGGVVFGCTHDTMEECLSKQLFGLPWQHISYVQNIEPGLPLFLFNYSDRKLFGIFEAGSRGEQYLDPHGWTGKGSDKTKFPAQVYIRTRLQCEPLLEKQFKPIILKNYYTTSRFYFELDCSQANALISLFEISIVTRGQTRWIPKVNSTLDGPSKTKDLKRSASKANFNLDRQSSMKLCAPSDEPNQLLETCISIDHMEGEEHIVYQHKKSSATNEVKVAVPHINEQAEDENTPETISGSGIFQLSQGMEELKNFSYEQNQRASLMEKQMAESKLEIQKLKDRVQLLESQLSLTTVCAEETLTDTCKDHRSNDDGLIYLLGGYNGNSYLSSLDSYSPSKDILTSFRPMSTIRSYAAAAVLNDHIYIYGGKNGDRLYDTVEAYNPVSDVWTSCPSMSVEKGNLAGATLGGKLFAIGGGYEHTCLSDVEMLDPSLGWWVHTPSMLQKRFAPASATFNGALFAVGGFDGVNYLNSGERFDPRAKSWEYLPSMHTRRGCHSLVALNEKLYAFGGYDGNRMVSSVEILDPRFGSWTNGVPMNDPRGYAGAAVIGESIYVIGGIKTGPLCLDTVERYTEETGWLVVNSNSIGTRCFFSAVAL